MTAVPDLDWGNLPFGYIKTDFNIRYYYRNGSWSEGELCSSDELSINIAAPSLHYGQQAFEGLKAFTTKDGKIVVFRPEANAERLARSCERIYMPVVPQELFLEAIDKVVRANSRFVPPYGTGASLYIRPLVIGVGPRVGLGPAEEYIFLVLVTPVGPYYKGGFKPVKALVLDKFDRAAPDGVGDCKVGGNYAAGLPGGQYGYKQGYPIVLYLDSKEKKYVDEFGTSNFIGIKDGVYLTPSSKSILPSITNLSLMKLAEKIGMKVEKRPIAIDEVKNFQELGAVGTAAVITPVQSITWQNETYMIGQEGIAGPMMTRLYEEYTGIQTGDKPDDYGWLREIL